MDTADTIADPDLKAKTEAEIAAELAEVRSKGYGEVQKRLGLSDDAATMLRENGIRPSLVEDLLNKKFSGDDIALIAEESGVEGLEILKGLTDARVQPHIAERVVGSARRLGALEDVAALVRDGSLANPQKLNAMLAAIESGDKGALNELRIAADLAREGHGVELATQGDIVRSRTTRRSDVVAGGHAGQGGQQRKRGEGRGARCVQPELAGSREPARWPQQERTSESGRAATPGFRRVADISIVHPDNPLFNADREALSRAINDALRGRMLDGAPASSACAFVTIAASRFSMVRTSPHDGRRIAQPLDRARRTPIC